MHGAILEYLPSARADDDDCFSAKGMRFGDLVHLTTPGPAPAPARWSLILMTHLACKH